MVDVYNDAADWMEAEKEERMLDIVNKDEACAIDYTSDGKVTTAPVKKPKRLELKDCCNDSLTLEANEFGQVYIEASDSLDNAELGFNDPAKVEAIAEWFIAAAEWMRGQG